MTGPLAEMIADLARAGAQYQATRARVAEGWRDAVWRAVDDRVFGVVQDETQLFIRSLADVDAALAEALRLIR